MSEAAQEVQEELTPPEPTPEEIEARQKAEEQAKQYGWRPKEEFDLEPDGWVDADRFLEFPSTQNKMLRDELGDLRGALEAKNGEIEKIQQGAIESARKIDGLVQEGVKREIDRLSEAQLAAVESADTEEYKRIEEEKREVLARQATPAGQDPEIAAYKADSSNAWAQNPVLWEQAGRIVGSNPAILGRSAKEQLEFAEAQIKMMYPAYFNNDTPPPETAPATTTPKVDPGGMGGLFKTGTSAADLPPDAVKAGRSFVEDGVFKDMEHYAKAYFAEGNS